VFEEKVKGVKHRDLRGFAFWISIALVTATVTLTFYYVFRLAIGGFVFGLTLAALMVALGALLTVMPLALYFGCVHGH